MSTILRIIIVSFVAFSLGFTVFQLFNFFVFSIELDKPAVFFAGASTTTLLSILARRMNLDEKEQK